MSSATYRVSQDWLRWRRYGPVAKTIAWLARSYFLFPLSALYLAFLGYPIVWLGQAGIDPLPLILTAASLGAFVIVFLWIMARVSHALAVDCARMGPPRTALAVMVVLACVLSLAYGRTWQGLFIYVSVAASFTLRTRTALCAVAISTLLLTVTGGAGRGAWTGTGQFVLLDLTVGIGTVGTASYIAAIRELRAAREDVVRLAVAEERLRFARDLHDLLGHSLSTITLKSELARRLVSASPEGAAHELDDVLSVAREALHEVREAVSGYRRPTLATELNGAREILAAADVACRCENDAGPLPADIDAVLAWTVREGVTNVVRHSRASHCTIHVSRTGGQAVVEVSDDGRGPAHAASRGAYGTQGSGLAGLAERVASHGGQVEAGPHAWGGFRLAVMLPISQRNTHLAVGASERSEA